VELDLAIRGGVIVDGSGRPRFQGDVGIRNGMIVHTGPLGRHDARNVVDAEGRVVAPGFIDPHTHLDPQLCWDPTGSPSLQHGVTTVVTGNCSLSLAPCRTADRDALARLFYLIEDIPLEAFSLGVDWAWEDFGGFADALDPTLALNVAGLVGHSAIRYFVMGPSSYERAATEPEVEAMGRVLRQSLLGGALGLSTSRLVHHVGEGGRPIPSRLASDDELFALCDVMGELGRGILQTDPGETTRSTPDFVRDVVGPIALRTGVPVLLSGTVQERGAPHLWREVHDLLAELQQQGARIHTQATPCRIDGRFTLERTLSFNDMPTWRDVIALDHDAKLAALRDPAVRDALQFEGVEDTRPAFFSRQWDTVEVLEVTADRNRELVGLTIQELADRQGKRVVDALIDLALDEDLAIAFRAIGRANGDDAAVVAQLRSDEAIVGSSDAGAHVTQLCGAGDTSLLLARWVREERALTLEEGVHALTSRPASVLGLHRRGLIQTGFAADLVVFDPDEIDYLDTHMVHDLPGGGPRLWRDAKGVHTVVVNGEVAVTEDGVTETRAGVFLRGAELS
jgi:N-acyl-D-amino-acid deacylase